jgi:gliding motility-associated-like protein
MNNAANAIQHINAFGNEGFVSSLNPGFLYRSTNTNSIFLFPVGSSDGTLRFRPVTILPENSTANEYAVRFNNYSADLDTYLLTQKEEDIENANNLYYHSIERTSGVSASSIRIHYLPSPDGEWNGMANWDSSQDLWVNMGETASDVIPNYSYLEKADWAFENNFLPYLLINVSEDLTIPNVFTPDNDGINDLFQVTSKGLTEFNLTIVNRWGNVVYESTNSDSGWDGTYNGVQCSDGTYFYILNAKSKTKEYKKHGHLTLIGN